RLGMVSLLVTGIATPAMAQQDSTVGRTLVVDSLQPRTLARSLSELLTSRFPGVLVWSSSGTEGTSSRIMMRGPNTIFGTGAPLVVVDGMVVDANPASFLPNIGGQQVSRLDDLDPADISSIRVVDGAAEGAPFGTGAANGVLAITTREGEAGRPRFRFTSTQGFSTDAHTFPASFTPGPGGLPQVNPLEDASTEPFRHGYVRDYRGEVSGGWAPATYYLSGHWEGFGGVYGLPVSEQNRLSAAGTLHPEDLNPNNLSRLNLRAGGRVAIAHQLDIRVSGWMLSSSLRLPNNDNTTLGLLGNGEIGNPAAPSPWGFAPPGDLFQIVTTEDVLRLEGTVNVGWHPTGWLHLDALAGHESVRQRDLQIVRNGEGPGFLGRAGQVDQDTLHQVSTTYRLTASTHVTLHPVTLTTMVGLDTRHTNVDTWQGSGVGLPPGSTSWEDARAQGLRLTFLGQTTFGVLVDEQADLGGRLDANLGARVDRLKSGGSSGASTTYPHVSLAWSALQSANPALQSLRFRASWAKVGNYGVAFGDIRPEVTNEVEGGADALAAGGALHLSVTGYGRHSHVDNNIPTPSGSVPIPGAIENTGVIIAADLRLVRSPSFDWGVQLGLWGNRNRIAGFPTGMIVGSQQILNGYPIAGYFSRQILGYGDANADGIIESGEVQVSPTSSYSGNPFPTEGATLGTTVRIGRSLRAGILTEYRAGNQMLDISEQVRCEFHVCAGVNSRAPFADQAAAAAATTVSAPFISNGAFFKIREVSVSIAAPDGWARAVRCTGATLTLAARNLLTWTSYRGLDPEVNTTGAVGLGVADLYTQPPVRTVDARVDLAF
ncbi:MAG TPA: TonB-dependent receptor plug domain-containing protein, partial [Gemmatimonadales bacterium]|nr:TonB-dependent receptor plug domain-containing protein [Gemmatimonadales bacterium]